jgi:acyl-CoA thioester hydrolase
MSVHVYDCHVRFSDVDVYGHVNNVKYFEYLQESRIRWFAALSRDLDLPPLHMVVAQTDVDYRHPILFRSQPYECWSQLGRVGNRSMTIHSEIRDGDQVLARAKVTTVFYDLQAQRAMEPHPVLRERLEAELTRTS